MDGVLYQVGTVLLTSFCFQSSFLSSLSFTFLAAPFIFYACVFLTGQTNECRRGLNLPPDLPSILLTFFAGLMSGTCYAACCIFIFVTFGRLRHVFVCV